MDEGEKDVENEGVVEFPEEILVEILLKLPVKSLVKFKRVCKLWNSIISSSRFAKRHFNGVLATNQHKKFLGICISSRGASNCCVLYEETSTGNVRAKQFDFPYQLPAAEGGGLFPVSVCNYCDGLICFDMRAHGILICNPCLPMEYKIIRPPEPVFISVYKSTTGDDKIVSIPHPASVALGYDSTTDDYKIVSMPSFCMYRTPLHEDIFVDIFSLKSSSWRKKKVSKNFAFSLAPCKGVYTRNRIHWIAKRFLDEHNEIELILYFEMVGESLGYVNIPSISFSYSMLIYMDSVAIVDEEGIWVLQDYCGMKSSWNKVFKIQSLGRIGLLSNCVFTRNENILVRTKLGFKTFDTKDGSFKETAIEGDNIAPTVNWRSVYVCPFVESLASPRWWQ